MELAPTTKQCFACRRPLPLTEFYSIKGQAFAARECRECHRTRNRLWYESKKPRAKRRTSASSIPLSWKIREDLEKIVNYMRDARIYDLKILLENVLKPNSESAVFEIQRTPIKPFNFIGFLRRGNQIRRGTFVIKGAAQFLARNDLRVSILFMRRFA
jgi:hypothetical protein